MQLPATGFPQADVRSTSRSGGVGPQSGASMWFGASTPPGSEYGSSKDKPYLNLRPKADNAQSPSITRYTFERATPQGWGFVLGDIDADKVTISATKADGTAASSAELGFQAVFNMCDASPKPSGCSGVVAPFDLPIWDPSTSTLNGNTTAADTIGASGWFKPSVSLRTLTFTFTQRSGFPIYQTWFAVKKQDVGGTINASGTCVPTGTQVRLIDAGGAVVATTPAAADGSYKFTGVAASDGYEVEIGDLPDGCIVDGPSRRSINLTAGDDTADFMIREIVPVPISGTVKDDHDKPVAGVTVTIDDGTNPPRTTTTDSDGFYLFDTNPAATYTVTATAPPGYTAPSPGSRTVTIDPADTDPVTNQDFVLDGAAGVGSIAGTVTKDGAPVPGATITITGPSAFSEELTTDPGGKYALGNLDPGTYTVALTPPAGTTSDDPSQEIVIPKGGADFDAVDFAIEDAATPPGPTTPGGSDPGSGAGATDLLPDTGGPGEGIGVLGLVFLVAGTALVASTRQRQVGRHKAS